MKKLFHYSQSIGYLSIMVIQQTEKPIAKQIMENLPVIF